MVGGDQTGNAHTSSASNGNVSKSDLLETKYSHFLEKQITSNAHPHLTLKIPSNDSLSLSSKIIHCEHPPASVPAIPVLTSSSGTPKKNSTTSRPLADSNNAAITANGNALLLQHGDSSKFTKNYVDVAELPSPVCTEINFINKPVWGGKNYLNTMVSPVINESASSLDTLLSEATQENSIKHKHHQNPILALYPATAKMNILKENHYEIDNIGESSAKLGSSALRCSSTLVSSSSTSILSGDSEKDNLDYSNQKQYPDTVKLPSTNTFDALRINAPPYGNDHSTDYLDNIEQLRQINRNVSSTSSEKDEPEYKPFKFDTSSINEKVNNSKSLNVSKNSGLPQKLVKPSHNNIQPLTHSRIFSTPLPKDSPILTRVLDLNKHIINNSLTSNNNNNNNGSDLYGFDSTLMIRREQKSIPVSPVSAVQDLLRDERKLQTNSVADKTMDIDDKKVLEVTTDVKPSNLDTFGSMPLKSVIKKLDNTIINNKKSTLNGEMKAYNPFLGDSDVRINKTSHTSRNIISNGKQEEIRPSSDKTVLSKIGPSPDLPHARFKTSNFPPYTPSPDLEVLKKTNSDNTIVDNSSSSTEFSTLAKIDRIVDVGDEFDESNINDKDIYVANDFTNVQRKWVKVKELGRGSFSTVILAKLMDSNCCDDPKQTHQEKGVEDLLKFVAIKITKISSSNSTGHLKMPVQSISKSIIDNRMHKRQTSEQLRLESSLQREFEIISSLNHPCIVKMLATNNDFSNTNVTILNYCQGGDLFDFASKFKSQITPDIIQRIFCEIVLAIHHLHIHNIVHRDIKLENILLNFTAAQIFVMDDGESLIYSQSQSKNIECIQAPLVTLADFGLSKRIDPEKPLLETRCGSTDYVAPELLMGSKYDGRQTDSWALGVLLYALMEGRLPFDAPPPSINPITGQIINKKIRTKTAHRIARIDWCWYFFKEENSKINNNNSNMQVECSTVTSKIEPAQISSTPTSTVDALSNPTACPNTLASPDLLLVSPTSSSPASAATTVLLKKSHSVPNSPTVNHYEYTYLSSIWKDAKIIVENLLVKRDLRWDTRKILSSGWCHNSLPDCLFMDGDKV